MSFDGAPGLLVMVQLLKVQNFNVSQDGFGAGEGQSFERPFGHADPGTMFAWAGATASWPNRTDPGGTRGLDDYLTRDFANNIGAEIMGRNKFSPHRGPWADHDWLGWWGDEPPFHTPVFVLTHHPRESIEMEGGTTFHFVEATPADVLDRARAAAGDLDVRIGGGVTVLRDFLAADLVDHLHVVVVPILLGRGVRLWDGLEGLEKRYRLETTASPSGVTHLTFTRL
jgi:dihydrofolate reductase